MDILSSDLLMSFFASALKSYKHDSLVRPFPTGFLDDSNEKDFTSLISTLEDLPSFHHIDWRDTSNLKDSCLQLIQWIINPRRFKLKKILLQNFTRIENLCSENSDTGGCKPDFLFEVTYSEQDEEKFKKLCGNRDVIYAYHGSRAENFHSILHNGLRNNLNKISLFGEGIYLSSDLRVCQTYSPTGCGWQRSLLGSSLSCIAVCQVIDHPDVKCSVKRTSQSAFVSGDDDESNSEVRSRFPDNSSEKESALFDEVDPKSEVKTSTTNPKRSHIRGSEGGQVPDKYYVVRNDDLVRVKYLYVYAPDAQKDLIRQVLSGSHDGQQLARPGRLQALVRRHKFFLVMLVYVVILGCISLLNSKAFSNWWRSVVQKNEEDSMFIPK